jgi:hypothetical protein
LRILIRLQRYHLDYQADEGQQEQEPGQKWQNLHHRVMLLRLISYPRLDPPKTEEME